MANFFAKLPFVWMQKLYKFFSRFEKKIILFQEKDRWQSENRDSFLDEIEGGQNRDSFLDELEGKWIILVKILYDLLKVFLVLIYLFYHQYIIRLIPHGTFDNNLGPDRLAGPKALDPNYRRQPTL